AGSASGSGGGMGGRSPSTGGGPNACTDPSNKTCTGPGECVLATSDCCLCGQPELGDYVAMSSDKAAACTCTGPACGCATMDNPNRAATCEDGTCAAWDVRKEDAYSACKTPDDCRLRLGLACCEPCGGADYEVVAIRGDAESLLKSKTCTAGEACG